MKRMKPTPKPSFMTNNNPNGYTKSNHQPHHQRPYNPTSITAQASNTTIAKNPNPSTYKCIENPNPNPNPRQTQSQKSLDRKPNITKSQTWGERYEPFYKRVKISQINRKTKNDIIEYAFTTKNKQLCITEEDQIPCNEKRASVVHQMNFEHVLMAFLLIYLSIFLLLSLFRLSSIWVRE